MGKWRYGSNIFDLGSWWRWVVSFTPLLLYSLGKSPRYLFDRRLGGPQSPSGSCEEKKNLVLLGIEPGPSARSPPLSWCEIGITHRSKFGNTVFPPLQTRRVPPHFSNHIRAALYPKFLNKWVSWNGHSHGRLKVPIYLLWIFFWEYSKNTVYSENIRDLNHLRLRIYENDTGFVFLHFMWWNFSH
jgi:hypothetical protein